MNRSGAFHLSQLEPNVPLLHHQHALFRNSRISKKVPTQLIYPDSSFTIGLPPTRLADTVDPNSTDIPVDQEDEERYEQVLNSAVLVHATKSESPEVKALEKGYGVVFYICTGFQLAYIALIASGWGPYGGYEGVMKPLSTWLFLLIITACLGVTRFRELITRAAYPAGTTITILYWLVACLYGPLDILFIGSLLISRYALRKHILYKSSQTFVVPPEYVPPSTN